MLKKAGSSIWLTTFKGTVIREGKHAVNLVQLISDVKPQFFFKYLFTDRWGVPGYMDLTHGIKVSGHIHNPNPIFELDASNSLLLKGAEIVEGLYSKFVRKKLMKDIAICYSEFFF